MRAAAHEYVLQPESLSFSFFFFLPFQAMYRLLTGIISHLPLLATHIIHAYD